MDCVQDGQGKHNCATMYRDFTGCENVQDLSGVTTIKCIKVYSGGYKHCSIKQPNAVIPQKDNNWKMCFDSGTWQNCPVEASCVPCADYRNQGQQDCVAVQKQGYKKQDFNCPQYKPGTNCQQYYDYVNQFQYTKTEFNWPEFEPYKKENQFFQRESFRTQDRQGVFIGQLRNVNRFSHNQGDAYESNDIDYKIPEDGLQFNLHIMMKYPNPSKTGDSLIEYVSKAVTVKRQPSLIDNSGYTINFRLNREVHFDSIVLSNPLKTGYNANLLPMEGLISYKNQTNVQLDKEQYAAGQKMYYVPYHRQQDYNTVKIKLPNRNFKTLAEAQMNLLAIPVSNPTNPLFSCIQITNDIKYEGKKSVTYSKNRMQLYQNVSISGEFFFNFDNCPDQTHYNLSQMTVRTFANLTDQCPIRRTCAPLNETCSYQVMYCNDEFKEVITTDSRGNQRIQVKSQLVCYDLHGVKWDTCKKSTDEAGNTYTRCDSSAYNPTFRGMEYKCTIAIPPNTVIAPTHPLVSENCQYTADARADAKNQKCELTKGCIDELKTNKSFVSSTTQCKLGDQFKKIRFFSILDL